MNIDKMIGVIIAIVLLLIGVSVSAAMVAMALDIFNKIRW